jgi:hypothetical protein
MIVRFICLANSKKYSERCIAGISISKKEKGGYILNKNGDKPAWIRPVTLQNHGQVPSELVGHIKILDVVEIEIEKEIPNGYQSENVLFKPKSLKVVSKINAAKANLNLLVDDTQQNIFGNWGKAVHKDRISEVNYSLTMVKVQDPEVYLKTEFGEQHRLKFNFKGSIYDLPITDVKFLEYLLSLKKGTDLNQILKGDVFLTISLGVEHEEFHYKLIAGIIQESTG